jgi:AcrR family transcriptional regulator
MADRRESRRDPRHGAVGRGLSPARVLERERVAAIQRERMLSAMVALARESGPERVTVAHVVSSAGVSRRTFYELFEDRETCFLAALDQAIERMAARVVPAYRGERGWCEQIRAGLAALLECLEEDPNRGALCVIDALAAGPRALERRARVVEKLVGAVDRGRRELPGEMALTRFTAEGVVGAVLSVLHTRLHERSSKSLLSLQGQIMGIIVLPYLGPRAAVAELARRAPRARRSVRNREDPLRGLQMRLTYRTVRVLAAVAAHPGLSNRDVARAAEVVDQGQISKLLQRLEGLGLICNGGRGAARGEANSWTLTPRGRELERAVRARRGE